ncbi:MAG TPA: cyclase family protein [Bdellovibrionales bacterium]|nr:cyclase family protein [Bdellovibrionales bacterium]
MKTKIFDLTPKISPRLGVFPGDQKFERHVALSMKSGSHLELSAMRSTVHLGAHADAPSHYHRDGADISQRPLHLYLGKAQVIRVNIAKGARVEIRDVRAPVQAPRVLIDTGSFPEPEKWNSDFSSFSPELLEWLADQGVKLVGIDTPSVDPEDSKGLEAHQILWKHDLAVLEGLCLKGVPEGVYTLSALPLPIEDGDASPVRAVLLPYCPALDELE